MSSRARILRPIVAAAGSALLLSLAGVLVTDLSPWYYALRKPSWQPPDALFGPAWTVIFACAAVAGVMAWRNRRRQSDSLRILVPFAVNAVLNVLWSWLFFTRRRPDFALVEVGFLWLSIAAVFVALWPLSHRASWLLTPYLGWVAFAAYLNLAVVKLNAPFVPQ